MKTAKIIFFTVFSISIVTVVMFISWKVPEGSGQPQTEESIEVAFPHLTFNQPIGIVSPDDETSRLFVVEQTGIIRVFQNTKDIAISNVFLDLTDRVLYGGEQGLLGLAFHPSYKNNGYFFVNYVMENPRRTVVARFTVSADPNQGNRDSQLILLEVNQPFSNHNGGQLAFGPDGYLYIGLGDGGSGGDPYGHGQNRSVLLGKILRIDVNSASDELNYGIPSDNPFTGNTLGYREEIYAYGFRNPWRFSFDFQTEQLLVADVGQSQREEIDIVEKGKNYGWNIMEGSLAYSGESQVGLELPVFEYGHDQGIAVVGGYVYRGPTATALTESYIYGDYGSGKIWGLLLSETPTNTLVSDTNLVISSFGVDSNNELFICAFDGKIYKFTTHAVPEFSSLGLVLLIFVILATFFGLNNPKKFLKSQVS